MVMPTGFFNFAKSVFSKEKTKRDANAQSGRIFNFAKSVVSKEKTKRDAHGDAIRQDFQFIRIGVHPVQSQAKQEKSQEQRRKEKTK